MSKIQERAQALAAMESYRKDAHQAIDDKVDEFVRKFFQGELLEDQGAVVSLCASPSVFKGEKPALLILPNGEKVETTTWKKTVAAIMKDCNSDPQRHEKLLWLRERLHGNFRYLLASSPNDMGAPLKIDEGLYMESKFDTEALLLNLKTKILDLVGYDYRGIVIQCRSHDQDQAPQIGESVEDKAAPGPAQNAQPSFQMGPSM